MRKIYLNTVKLWNSQWSHGHQLSEALAGNSPFLINPPAPFKKGGIGSTPKGGRDFIIYYFENTPAGDNPYSGLKTKHNYPLPPNIFLISAGRSLKKVNVWFLIYNQWRSLVALWRLRKEADFYLSYNVYDLAALILAKLLRLPTVFLFIDEYDLLTRWPKLRPLLRFLLVSQLRLADKVVVTAKKLGERARKHNQNVFYLPNAVGAADFKIAAAVAGRPRDDRLTIGFIGSLGSWVDGDLILAAAKKYPEIDFEIYGDGVVYDSLIRLMGPISPIGNLKLPGRINHNDFYQKAARFDLAIIPFVRNEITDSVSPIKLFEYWLAGLPVIARRTSELEQFDRELLLYETAEEFFAYIDKLIENRHIYDQLGKEGRKLVLEKYNWKNYGKIFNERILRQ